MLLKAIQEDSSDVAHYQLTFDKKLKQLLDVSSFTADKKIHEIAVPNVCVKELLGVYFKLKFE